MQYSGCISNSKVHTANSPDSMLLTLEAPLVDHVTLFVPHEDGFVEQRAGDKIPYSQRHIKHRNPAFFILVAKKQPTDFYLRVQSNGLIQIPMTLWSTERFIAYQEKAQLLFGAYYGFMMLLIMASFYVFTLLKEQVFFRYSLHLSTFLLFQMSINGVSFQFLWGEISTDSCGRYGGEEFIIVLTHTDIVEVRAFGERLKEVISRVRSERAPGAKVTASLGVAMCYPTQSHNYSVDTLIAAADNALYEAKEQGRNKVCFAPDLQLTKS